MSEEEIRRAGVLKRVKVGELSQVEAAEVLGLSYRQVKRIYRRYVEEGAKGRNSSLTEGSALIDESLIGALHALCIV